MSEANDGGPAFPHDAHLTIHGEHIHDAVEGMSLRDFFAAHALAAKHGSWAKADATMLAEWAYAMADAMLAARKERP